MNTIGSRPQIVVRVVSKIGRRPTLWLVSLLCVVQFFWTLYHERSVLSLTYTVAAGIAVILFLLVFQDLYQRGRRMARRQKGTESQPHD